MWLAQRWLGVLIGVLFLFGSIDAVYAKKKVSPSEPVEIDTGVSLNAGVGTSQAIKMLKQGYIEVLTFKPIVSNHEVVIDQQLGKHTSKNMRDRFNHLLEILPADEPRYVVLAVEYTNDLGDTVMEPVFLLWAPDASKDLDRLLINNFHKKSIAHRLFHHEPRFSKILHKDKKMGDLDTIIKKVKQLPPEWNPAPH